MTRITKSKVKVGMVVTPRNRVQAWRTYNDNPFVGIPWLEPNTPALVQAVDIPSVTHNRSFVNVIFDVDGQTRKASLLYDNIKVLSTNGH